MQSSTIYLQNRIVKRALLFTVFLISFFSTQAQTGMGKYSSSNKSAIRDFEDGKKQYDSRQDVKAIKLMESAIRKDSNFIEPWMVLGQIYLEGRDYKSSLEHYRKVVQISPSYLAGVNMLVGDLEMKFANYGNAKVNYENYLTYSKNLSEEFIGEANQKIKNCVFAMDAIKHPVPYQPINLGQGVNTADAEYFPSFTVDQQEIIFTRDVNDVRAQEGHQEDFFIAKSKDTTWLAAKNAGAPLNSSGNEGGPSISADGRILFFTACDRPDGLGSCDIYLSQRTADGNWSKPINLGTPINSSAWESQPSFSSDGKTLYFIRGTYSRDRSKLYDIFSSTFQADMTWSNPVPLSDTINSKGIEESVFIHPDNQTLYFSSDGHTGMGGLDIFVSRRQENGRWGSPKNLGYPINTANDDNSLVVSADGKRAYFSSNRQGGFGNLDLYRFDLYKEVQPALVSYVKARVVDAATGNPLSAQFEIIDVETGKIMVSNTTDKKRGEFLACLPAGKNYMLNVDKETYMFYSDYFECKTANEKQNAFDLLIKLQQPKAGEKMVLKNIFFDVNKFALKAESSSELNKLVSFLKSQSTLRIEVSGHTDNTGDKKANVILSEQRAKAVVNFLIEKGIPASRMTYKGYGDSKPVASNDAEDGRAKNRRTEFSIL
ncbi:MAG: PD40 domain-containing protein [Bacteroidia bacterium]|jgi:outer membrane protein OmpA-like peptidoglycan-associated protein/Tol biopolymer transport system component|nr:PD40 domain-containing protein [Bacteroidia bacterium]MBP7243669.1 PD40 domain-containing protein [Bacteroidia bacterium]